MVWMLSLLLLLLGVSWILWTPVRLVIHTRSDVYRIYFLGFARVWVSVEEQTGGLTLPFYRYKLTLDEAMELAGKASKKRPEKAIRSSRIKRGKSRVAGLRKIARLIRDFWNCLEVNQFVWKLDTGSVHANAILFPLVGVVPGVLHNVQINFLGINQLDIDIQVRPVNVLRVFIKYSSI